LRNGNNTKERNRYKNKGQDGPAQNSCPFGKDVCTVIVDKPFKVTEMENANALERKKTI
jgi:hypothetical protein